MTRPIPAETRYHRWLGWHAPALRRAVIVLLAGLIVMLALFPAVAWEIAVLVGWDAAAVTFLANVWPLILRVDGSATERLAGREDDTRFAGAVLLVSACVASLLGAGFALALAGQRTGSTRGLLIALAVVTVVLSWTVLNTVYALRYAHLYYGPAGRGIEFDDPDTPPRPNFRDFAYVAFTIGMTYQVADTALRNQTTRRAVLSQAILAYLFGVVIVAGAINLIADLIS
jgi:uncharacterized membrane protein